MEITLKKCSAVCKLNAEILEELKTYKKIQEILDFSLNINICAKNQQMILNLETNRENYVKNHIFDAKRFFEKPDLQKLNDLFNDNLNQQILDFPDFETVLLKYEIAIQKYDFLNPEKAEKLATDLLSNLEAIQVSLGSIQTALNEIEENPNKKKIDDLMAAVQELNGSNVQFTACYVQQHCYVCTNNYQISQGYRHSPHTTITINQDNLENVTAGLKFLVLK